MRWKRGARTLKRKQRVGSDLHGPEGGERKRDDEGKRNVDRGRAGRSGQNFTVTFKLACRCTKLKLGT